MNTNFEKLNEFSGIAKIDYRGEEFYVVYLEEDIINKKDDISDGYLGVAIAKGKTIEEALKEAIKNLSKKLVKYSNFAENIREIAEDLTNHVEDPDLDNESCGLDLSLGEYLSDLQGKKPRNQEEKKMWEHESISKVWLTEKMEPYLNPYP